MPPPRVQARASQQSIRERPRADNTHGTNLAKHAAEVSMTTRMAYEIDSVKAESRLGRVARETSRRLQRTATDRRVLAGTGLVLVLLLGGFAYAWLFASRTIDARLAGGGIDMRS